MLVVSIDIGYHNMGMVEAIVDDQTFEIEIKQFYKIDLIKIPHVHVKRCQCKLEHTSEIADLVAHFIQEYGNILDKADKILIERQPPTGLTNIEALIVYLYRSKIELVSPNSMHKHFNINFLEYEKRKERTVEFSESYLESFQDYQKLSRKHDIADAVCMIIFKFAKSKEIFRLKSVYKDLNLDCFVYKKGA